MERGALPHGQCSWEPWHMQGLQYSISPDWRRNSSKVQTFNQLLWLLAHMVYLCIPSCYKSGYFLCSSTCTATTAMHTLPWLVIRRNDKCFPQTCVWPFTPQQLTLTFCFYKWLNFFTTHNLIVCTLCVWAGVSGRGRRQECLPPPSADVTHGSRQCIETMGHPPGNTGNGMLWEA